MRLIDADKLKYVEDGQYIGHGMYEGHYDVSNAPTVDAIPIEWLKDYEATHGQEARLQEAIEDWRKENEQRQDR